MNTKDLRKSRKEGVASESIIWTQLLGYWDFIKVVKYSFWAVPRTIQTVLSLFIQSNPTSFPVIILNSLAAKPVPPAAPVIVTRSPFFIFPTTFSPNEAVQKFIPKEDITSKGID